VPTIAESAIPGYEVDAWQGVFAPAKTRACWVNRSSGAADYVRALMCSKPALNLVSFTCRKLMKGRALLLLTPDIGILQRHEGLLGLADFVFRAGRHVTLSCAPGLRFYMRNP
jgi:hypothetical protein